MQWMFAQTNEPETRMFARLVAFALDVSVESLFSLTFTMNQRQTCCCEAIRTKLFSRLHFHWLRVACTVRSFSSQFLPLGAKHTCCESFQEVIDCYCRLAQFLRFSVGLLILVIMLTVYQEFEEVFQMINFPVVRRYTKWVSVGHQTSAEVYSQRLHKFWTIKMTQEHTVPIKRY